MLAYEPEVVKVVNANAAIYPDAIKKLPEHGDPMIRLVAILVTLFLIAWAVWQSKRQATFDQPSESAPPSAVPVAK
jgi:predicted negative regulator of RcsB-dependent stress response